MPLSRLLDRSLLEEVYPEVRSLALGILNESLSASPAPQLALHTQTSQ